MNEKCNLKSGIMFVDLEAPPSMSDHGTEPSSLVLTAVEMMLTNELIPDPDSVFEFLMSQNETVDKCHK